MTEIIEKRQLGNTFSFLRQLDAFGVPIQLNFNKENKHKTRLGGFVSLSILGVLMMILANLCIKIQSKSDPSVLQEYIIVDNPARFDLAADNFSFAITLVDNDTYLPFWDESYYTITGIFSYKVDVTAADGTITQQFKVVNIELQRCTASNFQVKGTEDYFLQQMYQSMYCFKDISSLHLEGQFDQTKYSGFQLFVQKCQGQSCQASPELENKLKNTSLQVYYSNSVVRISDFDQPFQPIGQSNFWETDLGLPQVIDFNYMNNYIKDDLGLITSDERTLTQMLFSQTRTMYSSQTDSFFYKINFFKVKNQELVYQRSYLKLTEAVSQIGGIYNVLFLIGCILAQPYSYIELKRKLVNQTFAFSEQFLEEKKESPNKAGKKSKKKADKTSSTHNNNTSSEMNRNQKNNTNITNNNKNENLTSGDYVLGDRNKIGITEQSNVDDNQQRKEGNDGESKCEEKQNMFKTVFNEFKIRSKEYFTYYMRCFRYYQSDIQMVLRYGTSKVFEFTDICYIINKLIELEKIKHLILNEQQLKLFEYVPKPKITKSIIDSFRNNTMQKDKQIKQQIQAKTQLNINLEDKIQKKTKNHLNILTITNRSKSEKVREAQQAYNKIYKQQVNLSKIDRKLLLLLDKNHIPLFNNDSFDSQLVKDNTVSYQNCHSVHHSVISPVKKLSLHKNNYYEQTSPNYTDDVFQSNNNISKMQADNTRNQELGQMQNSQLQILNKPQFKSIYREFPTLTLDYDASLKDVIQNVREYNYKKSSLQNKN